MEALLEIQDLATSFFTPEGEVQAVRGISLALGRGESIGIVGESGCGKSVSMLSVLGLLDEAGKVKRGRILFGGRDLRTLGEKGLERIRGRQIAMVFQDPMTSLNPVWKVGEQLTEHVRKHEGASRKAAAERAVEMLDRVGIPNARERLDQYPIEFSGGMRQRVMIAMALITGPQLIIADEPTTALDVTIQAQILEILKKVKRESNTGIILITHDLGIVADMCDAVYVMYGGLIIERGPVDSIYAEPLHPYTRGLLASVPNPEAEDRGRLVPVPGQPPDLFSPPPGCPFAARCPHTMKVCLTRMPPYFANGNSHQVACWLRHEAAGAGRSDGE